MPLLGSLTLKCQPTHLPSTSLADNQPHPHSLENSMWARAALSAALIPSLCFHHSLPTPVQSFGPPVSAHPQVPTCKRPRVSALLLWPMRWGCCSMGTWAAHLLRSTRVRHEPWRSAVWVWSKLAEQPPGMGDSVRQEPFRQTVLCTGAGWGPLREGLQGHHTAGVWPGPKAFNVANDFSLFLLSSVWPWSLEDCLCYPSWHWPYLPVLLGDPQKAKKKKKVQKLSGQNWEEETPIIGRTVSFKSEAELYGP